MRISVSHDKDGDMNARIGNLTDFAENDAVEQYIPMPSFYKCHNIDVQHRSSINAIENEYGRRLTDICIGNRLIILNGRTKGDLLGNVTCIKSNGASLVDYTIVSQELLCYVSYFTVLRKLDYSDHKPILLYLKFDMNVCIDTNNISLIDTPGKFTFTEESARLYKVALQSPEISSKIYDFMHESYDNVVDEMVNDFNEILLHAAKGNVHFTKCKQRKTPHKPWFDKNMLDIRSNLHFARELHNKHPNNRKYREDYHLILKSFRKTLKNKEKIYKEELLNNLATSSERNPNEYWKTFNKLNSKRTDTSLSIDEATWFEYYKKLNKDSHTLSDSDIQNLAGLENANSKQNTLDYDISFRELKLHIRKLKLNKAAGPDLLCNEMIKLGETWLTPLLHKLFNNILAKGCFPNTWKKGYIINIHKSGSITEPGNYRGITLTSTVGKLFNSIMNERLVNFLYENDLQSKFQCGFRQDYRTTDNILILNEAIRTTKSPLYIAFIDFKKAFDKLWRHGLLMKLSSLHIGGNFYKVIRDMYSNNTSQIKLGGKLTPSFVCDLGVRQGDSLSPTLFNLFVDDISGLLQNNECDPFNLNGTLISSLFYADDLVILSRSRTGLQRAMNKLTKYCQQWHLEVNAKKSQIMITHKRSYNHCEKITFGKSVLDYVKEYKYLGVIIKNTGSLALAQDQLSQKAIKAMFAIKQTLFQSNIFDPKSMLKCFDSMVKPIMSYGCEIWGLSCAEKTKDKLLSVKKALFPCENIELRILKQILGVHKKSSNAAVFSEFGRVPLRLHIISQILKYFYRMKLQSKNLLLNEIFSNFPDNKNPYSTLITLLNSVGVEVHEPTQRKDIKLCVKKTILSLKNKIQETMDKDIEANKKLTLYSELKESFDPEPYLSHVMNFHHRKALSRLRTSSHNLLIETGRYNNTERDKRICICCRRGVIESEFHFLMECDLYNKERDHALQQINQINPTGWSNCKLMWDKFIFMLQLKERNVTPLISSFVFKCFEKRKLNMYTG